jgi:LPXTG-motif cell wall-anchored protein
VTRLAVVLGALLILVTTTPAAAAQGAPELAVTVAFDKPDYLAYEDITLTITVTNTGAAPANGVTLAHETNGPFYGVHWGAFDPETEGGVVQPGENAEWAVTVQLDTVVDVLRLAVEVRTSDQETDTTNNTASAEATITMRTADLAGVLYGDRDGDKQFDPGETMRGVQVTARGGTPFVEESARTDDAGRFFFANLPEGRYTLVLGLPGGWFHDESSSFEVHPGGPEAMVRAVRDASELRGSVTFDKPVYAVGDTIRERVTLTNTGTVDLAGVTARCVEGAAPNQLSGLGWGDLVHDVAPGVTVRAGETRTFDFTDVVPAGGRLYGFVTISCWFSTSYRYDDGPLSIARAEVPGGTGSSGGVLYVDRDEDFNLDPGESVPNVKVFLVTGSGTVVARAFADADAHFMFSDVPANNYILRVVGPWRAKDGVDLRIGVFDGAVMDGALYAIEPGPDQADLDVPRTSTVDTPRAPAPRASPPVRRPANLADTGASVVELTAIGVLLLLAGAGLLFVRRSGKAS